MKVYRVKWKLTAQEDIVSTENFASYSPMNIMESSVMFDDVLYSIGGGDNLVCTESRPENCWGISMQLGDARSDHNNNMLHSTSYGTIGGSDGWDRISFGGDHGVSAFGFGFASSVKICLIEVGSKGPQDDIGHYSANWTYELMSRSAITPIVRVAVDVRPRNLDPQSSQQMHVDLLATASFDPFQLDIKSVRFGPGKVKAVSHKVKDIDGNGLADLRLRFVTQDTGIECNTGEASLSGNTIDGQQWIGAGEVTTNCSD